MYSHTQDDRYLLPTSSSRCIFRECKIFPQTNCDVHCTAPWVEKALQYQGSKNFRKYKLSGQDKSSLMKFSQSILPMLLYIWIFVCLCVCVCVRVFVISRNIDVWQEKSWDSEDKGRHFFLRCLFELVCWRKWARLGPLQVVVEVGHISLHWLFKMEPSLKAILCVITEYWTLSHPATSFTLLPTTIGNTYW